MHVGKLMQAVARFNAFNQVVVLIFAQRVDKVYAGLVNGQDIG